MITDLAEITFQDDLGHFEMILDRGNHFVGMFCRKLQSLKNYLCGDRTGVHVVPWIVLVSLADVMKQQRQKQQLGMFQFL